MIPTTGDSVSAKPSPWFASESYRTSKSDVDTHDEDNAHHGRLAEASVLDVCLENGYIYSQSVVLSSYQGYAVSLDDGQET